MRVQGNSFMHCWWEYKLIQVYSLAISIRILNVHVVWLRNSMYRNIPYIDLEIYKLYIQCYSLKHCSNRGLVKQWYSHKVKFYIHKGARSKLFAYVSLRLSNMKSNVYKMCKKMIQISLKIYGRNWWSKLPMWLRGGVEGSFITACLLVTFEFEPYEYLTHLKE